MIEYVVKPAYLNDDATSVFARGPECSWVSTATFVAGRSTVMDRFSHSLSDVVYRSQFDSWELSKQRAYLGKIVTLKEERDALLPQTASGSYRSKPTSSRKAFERAKKDGIIVLNRLDVGEYTVSEFPQLKPIDPAKDSTSFRMGSFHGVVGSVYTSCPGVETYSNDVVPDIRFHRSSLELRSPAVFTTLENNYVARRFSSEEQLRHQGKLIVDLITQSLEIDSTLVTATRASANSGIYDLLTEVGELPETLKFIYVLVKEAITLFRQTRREVLRLGRPKTPREAADIASKTAELWLAWRYAVKPILYSVDDLIELLAVDASKYLTTRDGERASVTINHFGQDIEVPVIHRCFIKRRYSANTSYGDHIKWSFLPTAWELVPLSFIIDWFFNVGDYLSSFGVPDAVTQEACQYSWQIKDTVDFTTPEGSLVRADLKLYRARPIKPSAHIGLTLDVYLSLARKLDALALSWKLFRGR